MNCFNPKQLFAITSLQFKDGTRIALKEDSVVVFVGPNNSGKTSALRDIFNLCQDGNTITKIIGSIETQKKGTTDEVVQWLETNIGRSPLPYEKAKGYVWLGGSCKPDRVQHLWEGELHELGTLLCNFPSLEARLTDTQPREMQDFLDDRPTTPIHLLLKNDLLEKKINHAFRRAFGMDIILNRGRGKYCPLHVGEKPPFLEGEDRVSYEYICRLSKLPLLHEQGHGMRSFAGCLMHLLTSPAFIHLIDEPEAFLHPSHARFLGSFMASQKSTTSQLFIATHSGDFLRGVLDATPPNVTIIRVTREADHNPIFELNADQIRSVWNDSLLRHSNVLDGIFHEAVVVCESDSDCSFYSAMLNAINKEKAIQPDIMFSPSGGKQRLPVIIESLTYLGVKTRAISDFDVLRGENVLPQILNALRTDISSIKQDWQTIKHTLNQKGGNLKKETLLEEIKTFFNTSDLPYVDERLIEKIRESLKISSQWDIAKRGGTYILPSGPIVEACNRLLRKLREIGLFVVEVGELERFAPSIGLHGPKWVAKALERDLLHDPELSLARTFTQEICCFRNYIFPSKKTMSHIISSLNATPPISSAPQKNTSSNSPTTSEKKRFIDRFKMVK